MSKIKEREVFRFLIVIGFMFLFLTCIIPWGNREYEVVIRDENGYFTEYWGGVKDIKVIDDTILSLEGGIITYTLKPGEKIEINDYSN